MAKRRDSMQVSVTAIMKPLGIWEEEYGGRAYMFYERGENDVGITECWGFRSVGPRPWHSYSKAQAVELWVQLRDAGYRFIKTGELDAYDDLGRGD